MSLITFFIRKPMRAYIFLIVITMLSAVSLKANENVDSNIYFNSDIHIDTNAPKPVNVPIKPLVKTLSSDGG